MSRCDFRCLKPDGAQCELGAGHEGPHRSGLLVWHDPPIVFVDGKPVLPLTHAEVDRLERIGTRRDYGPYDPAGITGCLLDAEASQRERD